MKCMNLKKIFLFNTVIISILLVSSPVSASFNEDNILGTTTKETDEDGKTKTIITVKDRQIESYTSSDSATKENNTSLTVNANFLNDKYSSDLTTIMSLNGFIPSGKQYYFPPNNTWVGNMYWPSQYKTTVSSESLDQTVKIINTTPNNAIRNKDVSTSITYGVGGGVKVEGKTVGANIDANAAFTKTISYEQPDYETVQTQWTTDKTTWETNFTETTDGYTRTSWNTFYGNQIFMENPYTYNVKNNFTPNYKLSPLIAGGFSPSYGVVLKAPKNTKKSIVTVYMSRINDTYQQYWNGFNWVGRDFVDQSYSNWITNSNFKYEINWEEHTVKFIA
ncbi:enterococcus pore-forming toxin Epx [Enterococcus faecium]|uniref:enterococcus pore-forming toxin Epx n=1 Tax=Enterococcus faecium TaxID=1352 RepID=UPI0006B26D04|nr:enterococcus pore-forming toxin Epx [Enterococcus faecium]OUZ28016.1 hypothetical protein A5806_002625 [Enterococcus faecium]